MNASGVYMRYIISTTPVVVMKYNKILLVLYANLICISVYLYWFTNKSIPYVQFKILVQKNIIFVYKINIQSNPGIQGNIISIYPLIF